MLELTISDSEKLLLERTNLFNKNKDFFSDIPDVSVFDTINTFWPGVAYNLNYAVKKETNYE